MTDRELMSRIARSPGGKASYKQLVRELGLGGGRERRLLLEQLARLTARGALMHLDREQWSIPRAVSGAGELIAGRLDLHRDGYGFVRPNRQASAGHATQADVEDVFIPPNEIGSAMQGDQVLVELDPPRADGRRLGHIARVIERRNVTVVGIFHYGASAGRSSPPGWHYTVAGRSNGNSVVPFDERMSQAIVIPFGQEIAPEVAQATAHRVLGKEAAAAPKPDDLEGLVV